MKIYVLHYLFLAWIAFIPSVFADSTTEQAKLLIWGDSLSSAYGMSVEEGWVFLLQKELGDKVRVINGSVSGETTGGGRSRLPAALKEYKPDIVVIELGGNDGLRGFRPTVIRDNLDSMIRQTLEFGAEVILLGLRLPPNYGERYNQQFEAVYTDLAGKYDIPLVPFLLDGVAEDFGLMQADGIHPTATAQPLILANVYPVVNAYSKNKNTDRKKNYASPNK
jgi:acyl-CoA thioesterase-1